jgi:hypothetical protein
MGKKERTGLIFRECFISHPPTLISCASNTCYPTTPQDGLETLTLGEVGKEIKKVKPFWAGGYGK